MIVDIQFAFEVDFDIIGKRTDVLLLLLNDNTVPSKDSFLQRLSFLYK
jgi:hypothetical protein